MSIASLVPPHIQSPINLEIIKKIMSAIIDRKSDSTCRRHAFYIYLQRSAWFLNSYYANVPQRNKYIAIAYMYIDKYSENYIMNVWAKDFTLVQFAPGPLVFTTNSNTTKQLPRRIYIYLKCCGYYRKIPTLFVLHVFCTKPQRQNLRQPAYRINHLTSIHTRGKMSRSAAVLVVTVAQHDRTQFLPFIYLSVYTFSVRW